MTNTSAIMLSYHNDPLVKLKYITRFAAHRAADEVIQGEGFDYGRGCFVGCTLDAYDHSRFPRELGWPTWLAYLADRIFEGISELDAPQFGTDLLEAVSVGVDLEPVKNKFLLNMQRRNLDMIKDFKKGDVEYLLEVLPKVIKCLEDDIVAPTSLFSQLYEYALKNGSWIGNIQRKVLLCAAFSITPVNADNIAPIAKTVRESSYAAGYVSYEFGEVEWDNAVLKEYEIMRDDLLNIIRDITV